LKGQRMIKTVRDRFPAGQSGDTGFTAIEVVTVLVLVGILAAVVAIKASDHQSELIGYTEKLKSHLRYAQMQSMSSDAVWGIHAEGNQYWLFTGGATAQKRRLPGEDGLEVDMAQHGLTIPGFTVSFENWGTPCGDDAAAARLTALTSIPVSDGEHTKTVTITQYTGFIP